MRLLRTGIFVVLLASLLAFVPGAGAALVGIYRNTMESKGQLGQIGKLSGDRCARGGSAGAFTIAIGRETKECSYRTPVVGRDLEIAATLRLMESAEASKGLQRSAFLAVDLRAGDGGRYQLAVYPLQRKAQLRKVLPGGRIEYLHIEKGLTGVAGTDMPNDLRLSAFNITEGPERGNCRVVAYVGGEPVADVTDEGAGELSGRASGFSLGSAKVAKGLRASVDDVVIRVPSPF